MSATPSRFWRVSFKAMYRILALIDPLVRRVWRGVGIGNVVELEVPARGGAVTRRRLIGILHAGEEQFIGHPNGHVGWTRDLEAAGEGLLRWPEGTTLTFRATRLPPGPERERAIRATIQHPFPGNLVYLLGRRQVRAAGVFFRLEAAR